MNRSINPQRHFLRMLWGGLSFGFGFLWAQYPVRLPWKLWALLIITYVTIETLTEPRKKVE